MTTGKTAAKEPAAKLTLDPDKPYGYVVGLPGIVYTQGGKLFNSRREETAPPPPPPDPVTSPKQAEILGGVSREALACFRWMQKMQACGWKQFTPNDLVRSNAVMTTRMGEQRGIGWLRAKRVIGELVQCGLCEWTGDGETAKIAPNPEPQGAPD